MNAPAQPDVAADVEAVAADGVREAAERLWAAFSSTTPCKPVRDLFTGPTGSVTDVGYAVQSLLTQRRLGTGARVVGRKIGLTSAAVQVQLGVDSPDFGVLFDEMDRSADEAISTEALIAPRIEAEIAFVLGADLTGDPSEAAVRAATSHVVAALEIVDSRVAGWDITLLDTIADNASSGVFVLGENRIPLGDLDLTQVRMEMVDGTGEQVSVGTGAACLGDPVSAVSWLARTAAELGDPLRAGDVVLSGALGPMVPVRPGARFQAELSGLGSVQAVFADSTSQEVSR